jgi:hypothetical protein
MLKQQQQVLVPTFPAWLLVQYTFCSHYGLHFPDGSNCSWVSTFKTLSLLFADFLLVAIIYASIRAHYINTSARACHQCCRTFLGFMMFVYVVLRATFHVGQCLGV